MYSIIKAMYSIIKGMYSILKCMFSILKCMYIIIKFMYSIIKFMYIIIKFMYIIIKFMYSTIKFMYSIPWRVKDSSNTENYSSSFRILPWEGKHISTEIFIYYVGTVDKTKSGPLKMIKTRLSPSYLFFLFLKYITCNHSGLLNINLFLEF